MPDKREIMEESAEFTLRLIAGIVLIVLTMLFIYIQVTRQEYIYSIGIFLCSAGAHKILKPIFKTKDR